LRSEILNVIKVLFIENYDINMLCRSTWIIFSNLEKIKQEQLSIFNNENISLEVNHNLLSIINSINKKYNKHKLSFWTDLLGKNFDSKLWIIK
jgi:hypothetical protein